MFSPVFPQPVEPQLTISTNKYSYEIGEEVIVNIMVSKPCKLNLTVRVSNQNRTFQFLNAETGLNQKSIGSFDAPGSGEVEAKAWTGQDTRESFTYFIISNKAEKELYTIPAGGKATNGSTYYDTLVMRSLQLNLTGSQAISLYPDEIVHAKISFRLWNRDLDANRRWQIYIIYSWTSSWPPSNSSYTVLYDSIPGQRIYYPTENRYIFIPAETVSTEFDFKAPTIPGQYYLWFCFTNGDSAIDGVKNFVTPLPLPAYAKIIVLEKRGSSIALQTSRNTITLGESLTIQGKVQPPASSDVYLSLSSDNVSYKFLARVSTNPDGSFLYTFTPSAPGTYYLKASWAGNYACLSCESESMKITVKPQNQVSLLAVFIVTLISGSLVILAFKRRRRIPSTEDVEKHIEVAKKILEERNGNPGNRTTALVLFLKKLVARVTTSYR